MATNRLSKILAQAGVASRRAAEQIIEEGRVTVNGKVVVIPQTQVDPTKDRIVVDKKSLQKTPKKVYFLLNKPAGYICSNFEEGKKVVLDLFSHYPHRLFTVGRLDKDTTGLLLVTNDGHLANRIIHPSSNIQKEYLARTDQEISHEHLVTLSEGMWMDGSFVKPISVKKVRRGTIKVVVGEGKKREVRRLIEEAGLSVRDLTRIRIGGLLLGNLPIGSYKELSLNELDNLFP
ncbi:MAG: rRNA pseudouridine synthase [Parachlamydiales bacterium]|nr:rRNA pseudouridine synthase [Parachlamydiales bacterium]